MKITFGISLDGYESPYPQNTAGTVVVGPHAMLDLLETRLGLKGIWIDTPLRVVQYLQCLRECDDGLRFYSNSIKVDELAVARTLLSWRDMWIENGWDGSFDATDTQRIKDLATVEKVAVDKLDSGEADRLREVLTCLRQRGDLDLSLTIIEKYEELPAIWQDIFGHLTITAQGVADNFTASAEPGTDLALLQKALLENSKCELQGDGSVLVLSAHSESILAKAVAQEIDQRFLSLPVGTVPYIPGITLVNGGNGNMLDMALQNLDMPKVGISSLSRWRPQLQVLPLILSLLWEPLDPHRLLELLTNPVCPLPAYVKKRLAETVAEYPGFGGENWQKAITSLQEKAVEFADGDQKAADVLVQEINKWLQQGHYDTEIGAPASKISFRCAQVAQWGAAQANIKDLTPGAKELFLAASAQASAAKQILDEIAKGYSALVNQLQLNSLIDQVTAGGSVITDIEAECGRTHICNSPGAVIEKNDRLIWWNFKDTGSLAKFPWSPLEIEQLQNHGVKLPKIEDVLQRNAAVWLRPVLLANKQLILTIPRSSGNDRVIRHPLWDRINAITRETVPEVDVDAILSKGVPSELINIDTRKFSGKELFPPKRWWKLKDGALLHGRDVESFSSLNAFVFSPYQWVNRYIARLHPGSLAQIDGGTRQKGNLLHSLIQKTFETDEFNWASISQDILDKWLQVRFTKLLHEEGANFLLPGMTTEREELLANALRAVWRLIGHLKSANVVKIEMEKKDEAGFCGGRLGGYIDMLVTNQDGREAVIDLKLGGGKYRAAELKGNLHLQLTIYAHMRKTVKKSWPDQAYFILSEARMLAQSNDFFSNAETCSPPEGESAASLWMDFEKTWKWRRGQLDRGLIELTVQGTEADDKSIPPDDGMEVGEHNDKFNDFGTLTGWRAGM